MKKTIFLFLAGILLTVSCAPATPIVAAKVSLTPSQTPSPTRTRPPTRTPTASVTPSPTLTPSSTSTPQPTLVAHEWKPEPILITFDTQGGLCGFVCLPRPLPFILYGDGTLIMSNDIEVDGENQIRYLYKKLSQNEICRLLNTIDQAGFFEFDPDSYSVNGIYDALNWEIEVNAWNKKKVSLYALGDIAREITRSSDFLRGVEYDIPPSVINTYMLLRNYSTDDFLIYPPNSLAIWIWRPTNDYVSKDWTIRNPTLAQLYQKAGSPVNTLTEPIIVNGETAQGIYEMFNYSEYEGQVVEESEAYQIYVRPVLPFEKISGEISTISPTSSQLKLPSTMQCSPADGIMPIPTFETK